MTKFKLSYRFKQKVTPYIFILPFYLLFITFMAYPVVFSLIASFSKWNGVREMEWVGLRNYVNLIQDKVFLQSLINGLVMFLMYVPAMILFALILAILLNKPNIRFKNFFRTAIFVPYITSGVAIAYIFMLIFDSKFGLANKALTSIGLPAIPWLSSILGARFVLGLLVTWKYMGYNMILMMAGLQTIPDSINEAAKIDGANSFQIFTKITIPMMRPTILFTTILSTMGTFSLFAEPLIMTGGGPLNKTLSSVLYIYSESFRHLRMGYGSSLAYAFFLVMILLTLIQFRLNRAIEKN